MYSVMIVEDELLIRMGLTVSIPWESFQLKVVAEASNGNEAWELYKRWKPDLVFTDIRIPGMNGVDLMKAIKNDNPDCTLIVISCIDDTWTMRQCYELGACCYLVKATMQPDDIIDAVEKASRLLKETPRGKTDNETKNPFAEKMEAYIMGSKSADEADKLVAESNGLIKHELTDVIYIRFSRFGGMTEMLFKSVCKLVSDRIEKHGAFVIPVSNEGMLVIGSGDNRNWFLGLFSGLSKYCYETFGVDAKAAICAYKMALSDLPTYVTNVRQLSVPVYLYHNGAVDVDMSGNKYLTALKQSVEILRQNVWIFRKGYSLSEIEMLIDKIDEDETAGVAVIRNDIIMIVGYVDGLFAKEQEIMRRYKNAISDESDVFEMCSALNETVLRPVIREQEPRQEIARAVNYIINHLNTEISLNELANETGFHPAYLSRLFKEEIGVVYTKFVSELRIELAKTLLREHNKSIQDVARECGFPDISYFSRKFKEVTGHTPGEWRH